MQLIEDFDKEITIRMHGYSSLEEYYTDGSNYTRIPQLRTPLIAINTVDDPFVPYECKSNCIKFILREKM